MLTGTKAQKLLFQHTDAVQADLTPLLSGYYDTVNAGAKQDAASFARISHAEGIAPPRWLFLSDSVKGIRPNIAKTASRC